MAELDDFVLICPGNGQTGTARPVGENEIIMIGIPGRDFPVLVPEPEISKRWSSLCRI